VIIFHHVTVGVVEIDAATAVQMVDLARFGELCEKA
jgi:hypothetical protein